LIRLLLAPLCIRPLIPIENIYYLF
jgi:hypothetical protein